MGRGLKGRQEPWGLVPFLGDMLSLFYHELSPEKNEGDEKSSSKVVAIWGVYSVNLSEPEHVVALSGTYMVERRKKYNKGNVPCETRMHLTLGKGQMMTRMSYRVHTCSASLLESHLKYIVTVKLAENPQPIHLPTLEFHLQNLMRCCDFITCKKLTSFLTNLTILFRHLFQN